MLPAGVLLLLQQCDSKRDVNSLGFLHIPSFNFKNYSASGNILLFLLIDNFSKILCSKNLLSFLSKSTVE